MNGVGNHAAGPRLNGLRQEHWRHIAGARLPGMTHADPRGAKRRRSRQRQPHGWLLPRPRFAAAENILRFGRSDSSGGNRGIQLRAGVGRRRDAVFLCPSPNSRAPAPHCHQRREGRVQSVRNVEHPSTRDAPGSRDGRGLRLHRRRRGGARRRNRPGSRAGWAGCPWRGPEGGRPKRPHASALRPGLPFLLP